MKQMKLRQEEISIESKAASLKSDGNKCQISPLTRYPLSPFDPNTL